MPDVSFWAVLIVLWMPMFGLLAYLVWMVCQVANAGSRDRERERRDANHLIQQLSEKIQMSPQAAAELHAQERMHRLATDRPLHKPEETVETPLHDEADDMEPAATWEQAQGVH